MTHIETKIQQYMTPGRRVHLSGIGGVSMCPLAEVLHGMGLTVQGSDMTDSPTVEHLRSLGIPVTVGHTAQDIAGAEFLIRSAAIHDDNPEIAAARSQGVPVFERAEAWGAIMQHYENAVCISGTHGKTTTTSMLAWLMEDSGLNPSFMIGGIARNLGRGGRFTDSDFSVLEGDEYDTAFFDKRSKFLHYLPELVVINNIEFDHADIYNSLEEIKLSFRRLTQIIPRNGLALVNADDPNCLDVVKGAPCPVKTVGFSDSSNIRILDVETSTDGSHFTLEGTRYYVPMIGEFNIRNAAMAIAAAQFAGLNVKQLADSMSRFEGVARRQEVKGVVNGISVVDDFAHHPTAIKQAILGLRQRYPESRIWAIFEPRSNTTRRNIFQNELALSLATADFPVVAAVDHPDKVALEERLDLTKLSNDLSALGKDALIGGHAQEIVSAVCKKAQPGDVILVMSNGGFEGIHAKLLEALNA